MNIWIDADACPNTIKDIIFKAANRLEVQTYVVANRDIRVPHSPFIHKIVVGAGLDVADATIVERVAPGDLVITADIPLAAFIVEKGATGIDPRGELYSENTIRERLSVRNWMQEMREGGLIQGGPTTLKNTDTQKFANIFDRLITKLLKSSS